MNFFNALFSGFGSIGTLQKYMNASPPISPHIIPSSLLNSISALVSIEAQCKGPNAALATACCSGGHAILHAKRLIESGDADVMICGGAEAPLTPFVFTGFDAMGALSRGFNENPSKASRPFDAQRSGFVLGEGAGVIILESEDNAKNRGVKKIYCELKGAAESCDAFHMNRMKARHEGMQKVLESLLKKSGIGKEQVDYINAHGTSTKLNDAAETIAIKDCFGDLIAKRLKISSTKSMTGHCLGAAGGMEACFAIKALETGLIPPTINYEYPDPDCDLNYCPNKACVSPHDLKATISINSGFGGHNTALLFHKYKN